MIFNRTFVNGLRYSGYIGSHLKRNAENTEDKTPGAKQYSVFHSLRSFPVKRTYSVT